MNRIALVSIVIVLLLIPVGLNKSFAKTWDVVIESGSGDKNAKVTYAPWDLAIEPSDTVSWGNADTVAHTVTSGTPSDGPSGKFDSGLVDAGKFFSYKFSEADKGSVRYYCSVHPWMVGVVNVGYTSPNFKVVTGVGSDVGDGKRTFDIEYSSAKTIVGIPIINLKQKSITFNLVGKVPDGDTLILKLPQNLIAGPLLVWVDNTNIDNFQVTPSGGFNILAIPLSAESETVTVVGSSVIPEFGPIAALVFAVAIMVTIVFSTKSRLFLPKL